MRKCLSKYANAQIGVLLKCFIQSEFGLSFALEVKKNPVIRSYRSRVSDFEWKERKNSGDRSTIEAFTLYLSYFVSFARATRDLNNNNSSD